MAFVPLASYDSSSILPSLEIVTETFFESKKFKKPDLEEQLEETEMTSLEIEEDLVFKMPPIIKYTILADEVIYKKPQPPVIHFEDIID